MHLIAMHLFTHYAPEDASRKADNWYSSAKDMAMQDTKECIFLPKPTI